MNIVDSLELVIEGLEEAREMARLKEHELRRLISDLEAEVRAMLAKAKDGHMKEVQDEEPLAGREGRRPRRRWKEDDLR